jgi:hypothetical protein
MSRPSRSGQRGVNASPTTNLVRLVVRRLSDRCRSVAPRGGFKGPARIAGTLGRSTEVLRPAPVRPWLHRWLAKDREESYSDWLAWVLEKLNRAESVLRVLGVDNKFRSSCSGLPYRVEREAFVKEGAPRRSGRIDLLIHFGEPERALLGVEVKTRDEGYEKQRGYLNSLREHCSLTECVLVAIPTLDIDSCCGFAPRRWEQIAGALRREIAIYVDGHSGDAIAAMMCAFVAAIEQNLLEFGTAAARRAWKRQPIRLSRCLDEYLRDSLREVRV